MAYNSKHSTGGSHARSENTRPASGGSRGGKNGGGKDDKKKQKIIVIVVLAVLACIITVTLLLMIVPGFSSGIFGGSSSSASGYVPETQDGTTIISQYYDNGILPTSGESHGVDIIYGGGRNASDLEGAWRLDEVTVYEFDGQGRGILLTGVDNYTLVYSAENGKLAIDLDIDGGTDREYNYTISGDTLTMTTSDGVTYTLTRTEVR